jgi:tight adherence protein B
MGVLIGLMFGVGLLTVWLAATDLAPPTTRPGSVEAVASITSMAPQVRSAVLSAVGCAAVALLATGLPVAAAMAACLGAALPRLVRRRKAARTLVIRREAWPEVIDSLVSGVRAGMALPEAVASVAVRGPECLRPPFQQFADDYRSSGRFVESLTRLRDRLADPVADRIVEALLTARDIGGTDLGQMLRTLADFVRQDLRLRGEAEARRSWTVNGARLAVAAPWLVLILLCTRPDAAQAYQTVLGMIVLASCAASCALAYYLMTKIGKLPVEERVLL